MGILSALKGLQDVDLGTLVGFRKELLGLDIGSSSIKLVQLKQAKGRYTLLKYGIKPLEPEVIVDGTIMDTGRVVMAIKELLHEHNVKLKNVATSISGHSVIVKKITLPPVPDDELATQVKVAAEQYIPFDINEVNLDFHVLGPEEKGEDGQPQIPILLVAAKKDKVNELTEVVKGAGLNPIVLDVDAFAIENMYCVNYETAPDELVALVNLGASVMNINILNGNRSVFTRDISVGGNRYTEAIQREMGVPFEEADSVKKAQGQEGSEGAIVTSIIEGVNAEVASEIAKSIDYFRTTFPEGELKKILLSGGCAKVTGLAQQLKDRMGIAVELVDPFNQIDITPAELDAEQLPEIAPLAAVSVGLALRTMGDR
jgi:type IV pilus assembly protein PilM